MLKEGVFMLNIELKLIRTLLLLSACALATITGTALAESRFSLQSPGKLYRYYTYSGPQFRADQRSFRFTGTRKVFSSMSFFQSSFYGQRTTWTGRNWFRGSSIRANLPASSRTPVRRSYGRKTRYSSRERIISYRKYRATRQGSRGSTIGKR